MNPGTAINHGSVPLVIIVFAVAILLVFARIFEFMTDVAVSIRLSPLVPLLESLKSVRVHRNTNALHTNPVTHQTLLSFRSPSVPVFEVAIATLP